MKALKTRTEGNKPLGYYRWRKYISQELKNTRKKNCNLWNTVFTYSDYDDMMNAVKHLRDNAQKVI